MSANVEQILIEKVRALPTDKQRELLQIVENMQPQSVVESLANVDHSRPIWEIITEINSQVPPETFNNVPMDGSINLDHYLYGAPKKKL